MCYQKIKSKISGQTDKMHKNESKYKISPVNDQNCPLYFHLYLKNGYSFHIPQFCQKMLFGYFKSQISKCPELSEILPPVLFFFGHTLYYIGVFYNCVVISFLSCLYTNHVSA